MSTKTTFKRVAAVAAAALAIGGFSAVSAHATASPRATSVAQAASTGDNGAGGVAGPANSLAINVAAYESDTSTSTNNFGAFVTVSGAGATILGATKSSSAYDDSALKSFGTYVADSTISVAASGASAVLPSGDRLARQLTIGTPIAGTITVNVYNATALGATTYNSTPDATLSITVNAVATSGVYASSTVRAGAGDLAAAAITDSTTEAFTAQTYTAAQASADEKASFKVSQYDAIGAALATAKTKAVTIATTVGAVGVAENTPLGSYAAYAAGSANDAVFYLFSDGRSGVATITIAVNNVTVATYAVTFFSSTIAKLTLTPYKNVFATSTSAATAGTITSGVYTASLDKNKYAKSSVQFLLNAYDANGTEITSGLGSSVTFSSSNSAVATAALGSYSSAASGGYGAWIVTGTAAGGVTTGTATITVKDTATGTISATGDLKLASTAIASITFATDADSYAPGDKVTLTLTAKDKSGNAIADGTYYSLLDGHVAATASLLTYPWDYTTNADGSVASDAGDVSFKGGVATATFYAPQNNAKLTASLTDTDRLALALQSTDLTATVTVTSASTVAAQAAIDAAQEATDAANAAYDAANNAMDSADAATAAAQDASDNASAALAAVTSLSATVAKLVKSVAAIAAALAKVQKKIGA